jgi:hypothetical protein
MSFGMKFAQSHQNIETFYNLMIVPQAVELTKSQRLALEFINNKSINSEYNKEIQKIENFDNWK